MPDLKRTRNRFKYAIAALVLVDAAAASMLLTPLACMREARQQEMRQEWQLLKAREFAPCRGLGKKLPRAKQQIEQFYQERFPAEESSISASLGSVASGSGERLAAWKYS